MIAPRYAAEKPTENTKGNITENKMSHPNTVKFTECLETPLRVQNFGGNFKDPYHRPHFRFSALTVLENEDNGHKCPIRKKGDIFCFSLYKCKLLWDN